MIHMYRLRESNLMTEDTSGHFLLEYGIWKSTERFTQDVIVIGVPWL